MVPSHLSILVGLVALFSAILTALHENDGPAGALRFFGICFAGILVLMYFAAALGSALHDFMFAQ